jgi:hypothetical protein
MVTNMSLRVTHLMDPSAQLLRMERMPARTTMWRLTADEVMDISWRLKAHAELTEQALEMIGRCQQLHEAGKAGSASTLFKEIEAIQQQLRALKLPRIR